MAGPPTTLSDAERIDWLRLIRTKFADPRLFEGLLKRYETAAAALDALPDLSRRGGGRRNFAIPHAESAEQELTALDAAGGRVIALCEAAYPETLAAIAVPPDDRHRRRPQRVVERAPVRGRHCGRTR
jgi:DNA processing protein